MKHLILTILLLALVAGCRRADVREMTVEMPGLVETDRETVVKALKKYEGVDRSSFKWDFAAKTLTLRYDSMKIAQSNVRYAIDERGVKVKFPVKESDHAGY